MNIFAVLLLVFAANFAFGDEDGKLLSGDKTRVKFLDRGNIYLTLANKQSLLAFCLPFGYEVKNGSTISIK